MLTRWVAKIFIGGIFVSDLTACGGSSGIPKQLDPMQYLTQPATRNGNKPIAAFPGAVVSSNLSTTLIDETKDANYYEGWTLALLPQGGGGGRLAKVGPGGAVAFQSVTVHEPWTIALFDQHDQLYGMLAEPSTVKKTVRSYFIPQQAMLPKIIFARGKLSFETLDGVAISGDTTVDGDGDGIPDGLTVGKRTSERYPDHTEAETGDIDQDGVPDSIDPAIGIDGSPTNFSNSFRFDRKFKDWSFYTYAILDGVKGLTLRLEAYQSQAARDFPAPILVHGAPGYFDGAALVDKSGAVSKTAWDQTLMPSVPVTIHLPEGHLFRPGQFAFFETGLTLDDGKVAITDYPFNPLPAVMNMITLDVDAEAKVFRVSGAPFGDLFNYRLSLEMLGDHGDWAMAGWDVPSSTDGNYPLAVWRQPSTNQLTDLHGKTFRVVACSPDYVLRVYSRPAVGQ